MRLDEDDIAYLKMLEKLDDFEKTISAITGDPWRHPFRWLQARKVLKSVREFRDLVQARTMKQDELGGQRCLICGEPLVLAQPDCPDPQHH